MSDPLDAPMDLDDIERRVRASAVATGAPFEIVACDPRLADTAAFCDAYGFAPEDSANTIIVVGKSVPPVFAACVVLATSRLDVNGTVKRKLAAGKASFAKPEQTDALTGMTLGGVTAFGLPAGLPLWIDAAVMARPRIILGGGSRRWKVLVEPAALLALPGCEVVDGLAGLT